MHELLDTLDSSLLSSSHSSHERALLARFHLSGAIAWLHRVSTDEKLDDLTTLRNEMFSSMQRVEKF